MTRPSAVKDTFGRDQGVYHGQTTWIPAWRKVSSTFSFLGPSWGFGLFTEVFWNHSTPCPTPRCTPTPYLPLLWSQCFLDFSEARSHANDGVVERLSLGWCAEQREPSLTDWLICSSPRLAIPRRCDTDLSSSEDPIKRLAKRLRGLLIGCNSSSQYNPVVLALGPHCPSHRQISSPSKFSSTQLDCILPIPWRRILISHKS